MQSTGNDTRARRPLFNVAINAVRVLGVGGAFLLAGGCRTNTASTEKIEPPPTIVMPPSPQPANATVLTPPPAAPVFTPVTPPPPVSQTAGISITVKNGDSLSRIAQRYGVSAREIAQLNGISNPNKLRVGQKIVLPVYAKERAVSSSSHKKSTKPAATKSTAKSSSKKSAGSSAASAAPAAEGEYVVKSGDSISKIAANLHVTQKALREANNLQSDKLQINQRLKIPGKEAATTPAAEATAPVAPEVPAPTPTPTIDPLATPAAPAGVSPAPAATPAVDPAAGVTTPGAAVAAPAAPVASTQTFDVTVEPGETLDGIATKYGVLAADIKKLNNISEVAPGQKIKLPLPTP